MMWKITHPEVRENRNHRSVKPNRDLQGIIQLWKTLVHGLLWAMTMASCGNRGKWLQAKLGAVPPGLAISNGVTFFQSMKKEAGKPWMLDWNAFTNVYDFLRKWVDNDGEDREDTAVFEIPDNLGTINYRVTTVERKRAKTLEIAWTNDNRPNHVPINWHYIFYCENNQIWFKDDLVTPGEPSMITEEKFRGLIDFEY